MKEFLPRLYPLKAYNQQLLFILMLIILSSGVSSVYCQPITEEESHFGCHITHQRIAGIKFTEEELLFARAALERSDTFDILHYSINLHVTDFAARRITGHTEVTFRPLMFDVDYLNLDLEQLAVDSVIFNDIQCIFSHTGPLLSIQLPDSVSQFDTASVTVYYGGVPMTSASGFGGFYFENGYAYNLGIGLRDKPHNYGRAWFPCFDNFVERSTYEYHITHIDNHMAYCVGTYLGTEELGNGLKRTSYRMNQPIPTYLSSVAVSFYEHIDFDHEGRYGVVPVRLIALPGDLANFQSSFSKIGDAIDAFEKWYGPYQFERVGYVITTRGAMEHPTNVAYPLSAISGGNADNRLMAHELCHHWWGNVVTLSTSHNMWIKEGPAEYGAHLFTEHVDGEQAFKTQVKTNAMRVLRRAHLDDGDFFAISPMPEDRTYGTHTYYKGAMMIHNLRGYLGDELFASGMQSVLEDYAFSHIDAYQLRDHLTDNTGIDLSQFFDDWIFRPGYPTFEIDAFIVQPEGALYAVELELEQKLYGRDENYFKDVPVEIRFYQADFESYVTVQASLSDARSRVEAQLDFIPSYIVLNPENKLNMGFVSDRIVIEQNGTYNLPGGLMRLRVDDMDEPLIVNAEHHFAGADDFKNNPDNIRIGENRHWFIQSKIPEGTTYWAEFEYTISGGLDADLVGTTEDSIILLWRPDANTDWIEHPNYTKRRLAANDGQGFMRVFELFSGEYAFANGEFLNTSTKQINTINTLNVFPNPASSNINIEFDQYQEGQFFTVQGLNGIVLLKEPSDPSGSIQINLSKVIPGIYVLNFHEKSGELIQRRVISIVK
jgi:hypothetical protein